MKLNIYIPFILCYDFGHWVLRNCFLSISLRLMTCGEMFCCALPTIGACLPKFVFRYVRFRIFL